MRERPTDLDVAWAAGLFEGEGCISGGWHTSPKKSGRYWYSRLSLAMTDQDVVDRFAAIVGVGRTRPGAKRREEWKPIYGWHASSGSDVRYCLGLLGPLFGDRRSAQATRVLEKDTRFKPKPPPPAYCKNGHSWDEANTYVTKKGSRVCRACLRSRDKERRATDPAYLERVRRSSRENMRRRAAARSAA